MPPWGLSHVAFIILLFPAGLEDKLGVDASWHGAHSASWSLALSYPRFGAPRCSFSFGRIVVCPEGKRVSAGRGRDRKSTRLNSSHGYISYAVFCLKKKKKLLDGLDVIDELSDKNKPKKKFRYSNMTQHSNTSNLQQLKGRNRQLVSHHYVVLISK